MITLLDLSEYIDFTILLIYNEMRLYRYILHEEFVYVGLYYLKYLVGHNEVSAL